MTELDDQALALACSATLTARETATHLLGIEIVAAGPGYAEARMVVREDMLNGHGICHGGLIFSLADTVLAHASNSRNRVARASVCQIDFMRGAAVGATLSAVASERFRGRRKSTIDVDVRDGQGELVAILRGETVATDGTIIDPEGSR